MGIVEAMACGKLYLEGRIHPVVPAFHAVFLLRDKNIRKLIFNIQPGAKSNIRSSDNSKDDANSSKRKTNVQSTSGSGVYLN